MDGLFVKKLIFMGLLSVVTVACASKNIYVDELSSNRINSFGRTILLNGQIEEVDGILSICSQAKTDICIPIEAKKNIHDDLKKVKGSFVKLYGKYLDHDFVENSFLPSRFHVLKIIN